MLKKYIPDSSHVLQPKAVELSEDLAYKEYPVAIVDRQVRQLRTKGIPTVKNLWSNHTVEDYTWETEVVMRDSYPYLLLNQLLLLLLFKIRGRIFISRGDCKDLNFSF